MSDNLRRYRAIHNALTQAYPAQPTGNVARHLHTLAMLISGIVGSKSTQLPTIAPKVPDGTKPESRVKRFTRWLDNDNILEEVYFLPYADLLLRHLALQPLVLVMDGSVVGRGCVALTRGQGGDHACFSFSYSNNVGRVRVGTERSKGKHNFGNDRPARQALGRCLLRDERL